MTLHDVINYRSAPVYRRQAHDWYVEPGDCVDKLFEAVPFLGGVHDPACGGGNIPKIAAARGYDATGSDIVDRGYGVGGVNFLDDWSPRQNVVSNPPYVLAEKFALHALKIAGRRIALLVRLAFLESQGRRKRLFIPHPPEMVLVLSTRPSMPPGDRAIEAKGGRVAYCWVIWNRLQTDDLRWPRGAITAIGWLP